MKYLIACLLILSSFISFGDSFIYDGVKFSGALLGWTEPTKFSDLGNGNFEIQVLNSLYKVTYDHYDNSEKLYCYIGVVILPSRFYGGDAYTAQAILTCRTALEKFVVGIDIPQGYYDEEYSINATIRTNYATTKRGMQIPLEKTNYSAFMPWVSKDRHLSEWQKEHAPKEVIHVKEKNTFEKQVKIELIAETLLQGLIQLNEDALSIIETVEQYFSNMKPKVSSLSNKQDNNKGYKSQKIKIQIEKTTANNKLSERCKNIVIKWDNAHNTNDLKSISELFCDEVNFYHTILSRNDLIEKKKELLFKYPDFHQHIIGEIEIEQLNDNEIKCSFTKYVAINQKTTDYPSYLILKKSVDDWKISVEGDSVTDRNIAKRKDLKRRKN